MMPSNPRRYSEMVTANLNEAITLCPEDAWDIARYSFFFKKKTTM